MIKKTTEINSLPNVDGITIEITQFSAINSALNAVQCFK